MNDLRQCCLAAMVYSLLLAMPPWCQGEDLPSAESVLDRYVEATGGKAAHEKLTNRVTHGIVQIAAIKLSGKATIYEAAPNKNYTAIEIQGLGTMEHGCDGKNSWERNPFEGTRLHTGQEKEHHLANALFNGDVHWRKMYKTYKCVGTEEVNGKLCYKLELETQDGSKHEKFFEKATGLLLLWKTTVKTSRMDVPTESYLDQYRKVDGVLVPHEVKLKQLSQEITITVDKIEHNVKLPADRFDLPADLKKKVDG